MQVNRMEPENIADKRQDRSCGLAYKIGSKIVQFLKIVQAEQGEGIHLKNLIIKTITRDNIKFDRSSKPGEYFFCIIKKNFKSFSSGNFLCIGGQKARFCTIFRIYKLIFVWYQLFLNRVWLERYWPNQGKRL